MTKKVRTTKTTNVMNSTSAVAVPARKTRAATTTKRRHPMVITTAPGAPAATGLPALPDQPPPVVQIPAVTVAPSTSTTPSSAPAAATANPSGSAAVPAPAVTTPASPTPTVPIVAPPPDVALPAPPVGFVPLNPKEFQGFRPKATQMTAVPTAVAELNGSTTYGADFGVWAPAASDIATSLDLAYRWRLIRAAVDSFATYARTMDGLAWRKALTLLKQLEPNFDAAVAHNPALVNAYPGLERVFGAPKVIAQAATATKKKAAKVKAQAAATTAVNTATSTTPPATPATQAAPAATAGRTVTTVTG